MSTTPSKALSKATGVVTATTKLKRTYNYKVYTKTRLIPRDYSLKLEEYNNNNTITSNYHGVGAGDVVFAVSSRTLLATLIRADPT